MCTRVCEKCFLETINRPLSEFEKFVNNRWDYLSDKSAEIQFDEFVKRKQKKENKNYLYVTLSPDKFLRNLEVTEHNKKALHDWCERWFWGASKKWYKGYQYVIEGGSKNDHLHVHFVVELKSSHKHAEQLKRSWARTFPDNQLLSTLNLQMKGRGEYAYLRFDDETILEDKLTYFSNERKGTHENLVDLGLRGSGGSLTYN